MIKSIAISIPAYNDSDTIESLVKKSAEVLSELTSDYGITVIDDGSSDSTPAILGRIAQADSRIKIHTHEKNQGFGKTIKEVFYFPQSEWVFFIPGDGQVDPGEILKLLPLAENADYILGIRSSRNDPLPRRLNSTLYNFFVSLAAGRKVKDVNSVVLFRRKILDGLDVRGESAFVHAEIFMEAARAGYKIAGANIEHKPRTSGSGSGNKISVIIPTVIDLIKYFLRRAKSGKARTAYGL